MLDTMDKLEILGSSQLLSLIAAGGVVGVVDVHNDPVFLFAALFGGFSGGLITARDAFITKSQVAVGVIAFCAGVSTFVGATGGYFVGPLISSILESMLRDGYGIAPASAFITAIGIEQIVGSFVKRITKMIGNGGEDDNS